MPVSCVSGYGQGHGGDMVVMVGPPRPRPQVTWSCRVTHRSPVVSSGLQWSPVVEMTSSRWLGGRLSGWRDIRSGACISSCVHNIAMEKCLQNNLYMLCRFISSCQCLQMSVEIFTAAVRQCKPAPALLAPCVEILLHGSQAGSSSNQQYKWVECEVWVATARGAPVSGSSRHN